MIIGIGTDIVQIKRIEKLFDKYDYHFIQKILHSQEVAIFETLSSCNRINYLAKRFAGKEALAKALGTGIRGKLQFNSIAILNDCNGKPFVAIDNHSQIISCNHSIHISLADDYPIATAFAIVTHILHED